MSWFDDNPGPNHIPITRQVFDGQRRPLEVSAKSPVCYEYIAESTRKFTCDNCGDVMPKGSASWWARCRGRDKARHLCVACFEELGNGLPRVD
jgi:hypothetical protein